MAGATVGPDKGGVHRHLQVRVRGHDQGILGAHLQLAFNEVGCGGRGDLAAHGQGAREAHCMDAITVDERVAHGAAGAHHQVKGAGGQGRLTRDNFRQGPGACRDQIGGFEDHRITERQGRRDLPYGSGHGEIPGADDCHYPHRLAPGFYFDARTH